jgi:hypothetical protein
MSSFLYVRYAAPVTAQDVESELRAFVVHRCAGAVLNNLLQQYRVNVTFEAEDVLAEPFISGTSFVSLVRNRKKRDAARTFLEAMFEWARSRGAEACIVTVSSRPRRQDEIRTYNSVEDLIGHASS